MRSSRGLIVVAVDEGRGFFFRRPFIYLTG